MEAEVVVVLKQKLMITQSQVYALHARLAALLLGETSSLVPRHPNHWWPVIEDIFTSPKVADSRPEKLRRMSTRRLHFRATRHSLESPGNCSTVVPFVA